MLRRFGYFSTESNNHLAEYLPWYLKRAKDMGKWIVQGSRWLGAGGYLRMCKDQRKSFEADYQKLLLETPPPYTSETRSHEHGSHIIEALETGRVYRGHFNVVNNGAITNLPPDAIVEVPGYVDRNGINIPIVGDLPLGCAAVCNASISVQRLAVEAAVSGDDDLLRQAMMMDPLVGAVCDPPEIWRMVDELLVAEAKWLPQYKKLIAEARRRLAKTRGVKEKTKNKGRQGQ
jgi:alpha-galactosidase